MKQLTKRYAKTLLASSLVLSVAACGSFPQSEEMSEDSQVTQSTQRPPVNPGGDVISDKLDLEVTVNRGKASLNDSALKSFYKSSKASGKMSYESFKSEITTQANEVVKSSTAAKVRIIIIIIIKGDKIIIVVRR
jgi:hypothetical protein